MYSSVASTIGLVGHALVGPPSAPVSPPLWARPLWAPWALVGPLGPCGLGPGLNGACDVFRWVGQRGREGGGEGRKMC